MNLLLNQDEGGIQTKIDLKCNNNNNNKISKHFVCAVLISIYVCIYSLISYMFSKPKEKENKERDTYHFSKSVHEILYNRIWCTIFTMFPFLQPSLFSFSASILKGASLVLCYRYFTFSSFLSFLFALYFSLYF